MSILIADFKNPNRHPAKTEKVYIIGVIDDVTIMVAPVYPTSIRSTIDTATAANRWDLSNFEVLK